MPENSHFIFSLTCYLQMQNNIHRIALEFKSLGLLWSLTHGLLYVYQVLDLNSICKCEKVQQTLQNWVYKSRS